MTKFLLIILNILCVGGYVYCQEVTKQEVVANWSSVKKTLTKQEILAQIKNKDFDSAINNLKSENIDTFIFFKIASIGTIKKNNSPNYRCYLFWQSNGKFFAQEFTDKITSKSILIDKSPLMSFFIENNKKLTNDYIMPPIYSAKKTGSKIEYESGIQFHEKNYTLLFQIGNNSNSIQFGQSYFLDEKSLFYLDNISTASFHLFKIAEAEIKILKGNTSN
jgi:hypothetical protein